MRAQLVLAAILSFSLAVVGCSDDTTTTPPPFGAECGNGILDVGEECDGSNTGGRHCSDVGDFAGGMLGCSSSCTFDTSGCSNCGNGTLDSGEQCDTGELNGADCTTVPGGFSGGSLTCAADCTYNTAGCIGCGDDVAEGTEACDGTDLDGNDCTTVGSYTGGTLTCATDCTFDETACTSCGNGSHDTGEECDGTDLDSNDCTTVAGGYFGGDLACATDCTFDTAACNMCGNSTIDMGEDCEVGDLDGADCTTVPGGFDDGTLACTDCMYDTTGCTACGDGTIDTNEDCEPGDVGGADCIGLGMGYVGGTLDCDTACAFVETGCMTAADVSTEIAAARATADSSGLSLPISGAWVTYVRAQIVGDVAGFFIQAEQTGPALFIAVDPASLSPVPQVGDGVAFTIESMATSGSLRQADAISGLTLLSVGNDVSTLIQDVNAATDLVTALDDYESELITIDVTVTGSFNFAGSSYSGAVVDTAGMTSDPDLLLRAPDALLDELDIVTGCAVTVNGTPMWRFNTDAQLSLWVAADASVTSCPAPQVVSAVAADPTTVVITFDRHIDDASITDAATQFSLDGGLTVSAAAVNGKDVVLTTSSQTGGTTYTVTVAASVTDTLGAGVDAAANQTTFLGFSPPAVVRINEINGNIVGSCDLIELRVVTGGSMEGFQVWERDRSVLTFSGLIVDTNDMVVVHFDRGDTNCRPDATACGDGETGAPDANPVVGAPGCATNYDTAYDWYMTDSGMTGTDNVITLYDALGNVMDGVLLTDAATGTAAAGSETQADVLATAGEWEMIGGGVPAAGFVDDDFNAWAVLDLNGTSTTAAGTSIQRVDDNDTNTKADWSDDTSIPADTWGLINVGQTAF